MADKANLEYIHTYIHTGVGMSTPIMYMYIPKKFMYYHSDFLLSIDDIAL